MKKIIYVSCFCFASACALAQQAKPAKPKSAPAPAATKAAVPGTDLIKPTGEVQVLNADAVKGVETSVPLNSELIVTQAELLKHSTPPEPEQAPARP